MNYIEPRLLKGFRDYGPKEQTIRQQMVAKIQNVFERFGFLPMSTPVLEYKEILTGKYGEDEKLIYSFKDNGDRDVAMRYDLTVPLARFVAQNKQQIVYPFKRYQIAPVWRADNPQKGRLREFMQCDIDVIGSDSLLADVGVVACVCSALDEIGVDNYELRISNRGIFNTLSRAMHLDSVQSIEVVRAIDKVKKIGIDGVVKLLQEKQIPNESISMLQTYLEVGEGDEALKELEISFNGVIAEEVRSVGQFINLLKIQGIRDSVLIFDPSIARGMDYYTGFVFEVTMKDNSDFGSIGGGGRYDNLLSTFSSESLPAVGFSIGIDRLFNAMEDSGRLVYKSTTKALIFNVDPSLQTAYLELATKLRAHGINSDIYYSTAKLDKQFKYAESYQIPYAIIMGGDEAAKGVFQVKNLETREQKVVDGDQLIELLSASNL